MSASLPRGSPPPAGPAPGWPVPIAIAQTPVAKQPLPLLPRPLPPHPRLLPPPRQPPPPPGAPARSLGIAPLSGCARVREFLCVSLCLCARGCARASLEFVESVCWGGTQPGGTRGCCTRVHSGIHPPGFRFFVSRVEPAPRPPLPRPTPRGNVCVCMCACYVRALGAGVVPSMQHTRHSPEWVRSPRARRGGGPSSMVRLVPLQMCALEYSQ